MRRQPAPPPVQQQPTQPTSQPTLPEQQKSTSPAKPPLKFLPKVEEPSREEMARRLASPITEAQRSALEGTKGAIVIGNPQGKTVFTNFMNANCGACRHELKPFLELAAKNPDVKIIIKSSVNPNGPNAPVTRVLFAAAQFMTKDQIKTVLNDLATSKEEWKVAEVFAAFSRAKVDTIQIAAHLNSTQEEMVKSHALAKELGLTGTPFTVIGAQKLEGTAGLEGLEKAIAEMGKK